MGKGKTNTKETYEIEHVVCRCTECVERNKTGLIRSIVILCGVCVLYISLIGYSMRIATLEKELLQAQETITQLRE